MKAKDQFIVKVADTLDDAVKLMEVGFEYHAEVERHKYSGSEDIDRKHN